MIAHRRFAPLLGASLFALIAAQPALAQTAPPPVQGVVTRGDTAACKAQPTPPCIAEMALEAAQWEPEGWAMTSAFETFIQFDADIPRREEWMKRYEAWVETAKVDGVKDRIMPVKAEHRARQGDFDGAYKVLGLEQANPDTLGDPSTLILDEARSGRVKEALGRIDKLVEAEGRDELRLDILEIAQTKSQADADAVVASVKDQYQRRMAQAFAAGARGDMAAIAPMIEEWAKTANAKRPAPFDDAAGARAESWDAFIRGAMVAGNVDAFKAGLAKRGKFDASGDGEAVGRMLRPLIREGRADWIRLVAPSISLPKDEPLQVEEDLTPMKDLPIDKLSAVVDAAGDIAATNNVVADLAIEMLATRGETAAALKMFIDKGRLAELNRVQYDQERVAITFETLVRALIGRKDSAGLETLKAQVTSQGAKDYMARINGLGERLKAILAGQSGDEPSEEDWSNLVEMAQSSGDAAQMVTLASAIKEPGLRSSALAQIAQVLWEKGVR